LVEKNGSKIWSRVSLSMPQRYPDGHPDVPARLTPCRAACVSDCSATAVLDGQAAAVRHGVGGVHGEVHEDLLDLADVRVDPWNARRQVELDVDVLGQGAPQQLFESLDRLVEVQGRNSSVCFREKARSCRTRSRARFPARRIWFTDSRRVSPRLSSPSSSSP
jgi:hypothetical protein